MAVAPAGYNYATGAGIHSFSAAIIFSIIYALLFVAFSFKSFTRPTYVFFMMTFFCLSTDLSLGFPSLAHSRP